MQVFGETALADGYWETGKVVKAGIIGKEARFMEVKNLPHDDATSVAMQGEPKDDTGTFAKMVVSRLSM